MKPIRLSAHARGYLHSRGFTAVEVEDAIRTSPWQSAELGRLECQKDFPFGREWNGKTYTTKVVRPVFVEEATEIVIMTVLSAAGGLHVPPTAGKIISEWSNYENQL